MIKIRHHDSTGTIPDEPAAALFQQVKICTLSTGQGCFGLAKCSLFDCTLVNRIGAKGTPACSLRLMVMFVETGPISIDAKCCPDGDVNRPTIAAAVIKIVLGSPIGSGNGAAGFGVCIEPAL